MIPSLVFRVQLSAIFQDKPRRREGVLIKRSFKHKNSTEATCIPHFLAVSRIVSFSGASVETVRHLTNRASLTAVNLRPDI